MGWLAARRGAATPWKVGAVSATVNLLVVGSLFSRDAGDVWQEGLLWIGGLYGASIALSVFGGWVAARMGGMLRAPQGGDPVNLFATVAAITVFLLLITGGLVTGLEEGLAVPDWPNTFGHNMLLYPISEMKGGVYYEHVHRLFGTLVGLTTLVLAALAWANRAPSSIRWGATALLAAVTLQGLMGGIRVTGAITLSQASEDLAPSITFAVMHGVFGQAVFAGLCVLAVASCPAWRDARAAVARAASNPGVALIVILLVQLVLGALYRHLQIPSPDGGAPAQPKWAMHAHLSWSVVALAACIWAGIRAMRAGAAPEGVVAEAACAGSKGLRRSGAALHGLVTLQVVLGFLALIWVLKRDSAAIPTLEVVFTTAHQATGALLLASAAMAWAWFLTVPAQRA
jgi:cytochrome c oxidase assembly protein subunit 15